MSFEYDLILGEIKNVLKSFQNNKSPGRDGFSKELWNILWPTLRDRGSLLETRGTSARNRTILWSRRHPRPGTNKWKKKQTTFDKFKTGFEFVHGRRESKRCAFTGPLPISAGLLLMPASSITPIATNDFLCRHKTGGLLFFLWGNYWNFGPPVLELQIYPSLLEKITWTDVSKNWKS